MDISVTDRREVHRYLRSVNQQKYVTRVDESSLLHLSVNDDTVADDFFIDRTCKYAIKINETSCFHYIYCLILGIHACSQFGHFYNVVLMLMQLMLCEIHLCMYLCLIGLHATRLY